MMDKGFAKSKKIHLPNTTYLISNVTKANIITLPLTSGDADIESTTCGLLLPPWLTKAIINNNVPKATDIFSVVLDQMKSRMRSETLAEGMDEHHVASKAFFNNFKEDNIEDGIRLQQLFAWARNAKAKHQCLSITSIPAAMDYHDRMKDVLSKHNKSHDIEVEQ